MPIQLKKNRAFDSFNMTPMIDVVFILLIFFLVAARFAQEDRELPVQLPSAQSAVPMTMEPAVMTVGISDKGEFFVEGEGVGIESLEKKIQQAVTDNPVNQTVVIRGDRRVPFQHVVSVMDLCHRLKVPSYKVTAGEPEE